MASMVINSAFSLRPAKGIDCHNYVGLKPRTTSLRFNSVRTAWSPPLISPHRNQSSPAIIRAVTHETIYPQNLVYPLFIRAGDDNNRDGRWRDEILTHVTSNGFDPILIYPIGHEACSDYGMVPQTIRLLKDTNPDVNIYMALDLYLPDGCDSIINTKKGLVMNDEIVILCNQAISYASAGVDVVSVGSTLDCHVGAIRAALDAEGFREVVIMCHTKAFTLYDNNGRHQECQEVLVDPHGDESGVSDILLREPGWPCLYDTPNLRFNSSNLPIGSLQVASYVSRNYLIIRKCGITKRRNYNVKKEMESSSSLDQNLRSINGRRIIVTQIFYDPSRI